MLQQQHYKGRQRVLRELGLAASTKDEKSVLPRKLYQPLSNQATNDHVGTADAVSNTTCLSLFHLSGISPFGLLEELFKKDPWRLLISTIMLNRTTRVQVDVVLHDFLLKYPDATTCASLDDNAAEEQLAKVIYPLGMRHKRAKGIIRFSREWLELLSRKQGVSNDSAKSPPVPFTSHEKTFSVSTTVASTHTTLTEYLFKENWTRLLQIMPSRSTLTFTVD